ncbi:MAG: pyridoxamine 5'-phosphate oxidase family protein [Rhodospirillales bacterium]|nr:pyridoxamine 5'-phosphate oxidase family protein [Rhodospirillales bacterium]
MSAFTPTDRSRAKRLYQRAHYDRETVYRLIDEIGTGTVAYVIEGQPYVTPTLVWLEGDRLYWHGSSASRMLRQVRNGIPVCVNVFHLDGFVLARSGLHSSVNYRSATLFGTARMVEGDDEKEASLKAFLEHFVPGRWDTLRPIQRQEIKATMVVGMEIEEASAKIRTGHCEDDEEDYALDIWAGVVPIRSVIGEPEDDPKLKAGVPRPDHLKNIRIG